MKVRLSTAIAASVALAGSLVVFTPSASAAVGIRVSGGRILEANGNDFVMRGVNHPHTWFTTRTNAFADIKSLGANTVRVVLSSGDRWTRNNPSDVANVISLCKTNRLICVLEVHDTTGYGEESAAVSLDRAVDYWLTLRSVLAGEENYVIINIGNEPYGNQGYSSWTTDTINAIRRLRSNGFQHAIMVDAPNWGQDWSFTMRDNAAAVFDADPQKNTIFSIHMYGVFNTAAKVSDYLDHFRRARLPIVIGEFGHNHSDGDPDEDAIMAYAQTHGIGYLGWSWSGNSGGVEYLDMVDNFNVNQLTSWGQRIFNGPNGIKTTSREAAIFSGPHTSPSTPPTTPPTTTPPGGGGCTATYTITGQWPGGFQADVRVTAGSAPIRGWTVTWTFTNGQQVTHAWGATISSSGATVTARNASYNGSLGAGASTSFGFLGSWQGTNSVPAVTCTAS